MPIPPFSSAPTPDATSIKKGKVQLAGDLTGTAASPALTTTGVSASTYGDSVTVPVFTVDAKGRITGVTNTPISFGSGNTKNICIYATAAPLPANIYNNGASGVGATLTGVSVGALTVDGQTVQTGQRILVKDEVTDSRNGIYTVTTVGTALVVYVLTRATDFDQSSEIQGGDLVPIDSDPFTGGTTNDDTVFITVTASSVTVGTTSIDFAASGKTYSAGVALGLSGTTFNTQTDGVSIDVNGSNQLRRMAVTGDISIPTGSGTSTLPNIVTGATVGSSTQIPVLTYNNKGQITGSTTASPSVTAPTQRTFAYFVS